MSRKRRRGNKSAASTSSASNADAASPKDAGPEPAPTATAASPRKRRRSEKIREQREARKSADSSSKGIRPWILPGFAGIAIIAIVLIGVSALGQSGDSDAPRVPPPMQGERTAQVVIQEFGDFQCPFCGVFSRSIKPELKQRFIDTGLVRFVWRDFAWHGHESRTAANAARCADEQDMFWEFHDLLFENQAGDNQGAFSNDNLKRFGAQLGLETAPFHQCVDENRYAGAIDADMSRVRRLGLNGTPSFLIGDTRIVGAQPIEVFEQAIQAELLQRG